MGDRDEWPPDPFGTEVVDPRLVARLQADLPITVIRAPSGFGKSTLLAAWLRDTPPTGQRVVRLRIDPSGADAAEFWTDLRDELLTAGFPPARARSSYGAVVRMLRAAPTPSVLVLDDFDRVFDAHVDVELVDLVREVPALRVVIALRSDVRFRRETWGVVDGLELGARDLILDASQTAEVLRRRGASVTDQQAAVLQAGVRGWPRGVRALAMLLEGTQDVDVPATLAAVAAELRESTIAHFDQSMLQTLVLPSAVPERFTADVLRAIGVPDAAKADLDVLVARGLLFVRVDDGEDAYTWPATTRTALLDEFLHRSPGQVRRIRRRLARDFARSGDTAHLALQHAMDAADWPQAVRIVEKWWAYLVLDHLDVLRRALSGAPSDLFTSAAARAAREISHPTPEHRAVLAQVVLPDSPRSLAALARSADLRRVIDTAALVGIALRSRDMLEEAAAHYDRLGIVVEHARGTRSDEVADRIPGIDLQAGLGRLLAGDVPGAAPLLERAYLRGNESRMGYTRRDAAGKLALAEALRGEVVRAGEWLRRSDVEPQAQGTVREHIEASRAAARALAATGRLDDDLAQAAIADVVGGPLYFEFWMFALHARAQAALHWGDRVGTLRLLREQRANPPRPAGAGFAQVLLLVDELDLLMATGAASAAFRLLVHTDVEDQPSILIRRARLALHSGDLTAALDHARAAISADAGAAAGADVDVEALLIESIARARLGQDATTALRLAALRASDSGYLRPFVLVPRRDLDTLAADVPEAARILARPEVRGAAAVFGEQMPLATLTDRERAILGRLADGSTLQDIARADYVSINTVKTQVRGLYRKLGGVDRDSALHRAREQGLL